MKSVLLVMAFAVAMGGCVSSGGVATSTASAHHGVVVSDTRDCGKIKVEWLRQQKMVPKAEGVLAEAAEVAVARGGQIDLANERITASNAGNARVLAAIKKYGCVEVEDGD